MTGTHTCTTQTTFTHVHIRANTHTPWNTSTRPHARAACKPHTYTHIHNTSTLIARSHPSPGFYYEVNKFKRAMLTKISLYHLFSLLWTQTGHCQQSRAAAKKCCKLPLFSISNDLALERLCALQKLTWIFSELSEHCGRGWWGETILKDPKRDPRQHCPCFHAIVMLGVVWHLHQMEIKSLFSTISMTWET